MNPFQQKLLITKFKVLNKRTNFELKETRLSAYRVNQNWVDRDKPGIKIWNYGVGIPQSYQLDYHYNSDSFKVSFIMIFLNMLDYPVFFPMLSHRLGIPS